MGIEFSARTDVGRVRDHNEDNFLVDRKLQLYIVCDGMGGHASGEIASATAVNVVRETLLYNRAVIDGFQADVPTATAGDVRELLADAVETANSRIYERGLASQAQRGMGTTLSLLMLIKGRGFVAHVGDSRIYRLRGGVVEQVTRDHSLVEEMLAQQSELSRDELEARYKNAITRAVGVTATVDVDTLDFPLHPGDRYLLCSDGLHGYFERPGQLDKLIQIEDLDKAAETMIRFANAAGGKDNITALLVQIPGTAAAPELSAPTVPNVDMRPRSEPQPEQHPEPHGVLQRIRRMPLFRHFSDEELTDLVGLCTERTFAPRAPLWEEGAATDGLHIILAGEVRVSRGGVLVSRVSEGQYVGSITSMDGGKRRARVAAGPGQPVRTLLLERKTFHRLLVDHPEMGVKLMWGLARGLGARLLAVTERLVKAETSTARPGATAGGEQRGASPNAAGAAGGAVRQTAVSTGEWWPPTLKSAPSRPSSAPSEAGALAAQSASAPPPKPGVHPRVDLRAETPIMTPRGVVQASAEDAKGGPPPEKPDRPEPKPGKRVTMTQPIDLRDIFEVVGDMDHLKPSFAPEDGGPPDKGDG